MTRNDGKEKIHMDCVIAGGGPAGMMLGLLLARAGAEVTVLEKHADFFRDFRGDTVHPSTLEVMHELGLLEEFLTCPHQKVSQLQGKIGDTDVIVADFSRLKVHAPYVAFMPQWDFLNFLAQQGRRYPGFHLRMGAEVIDLVGKEGCVIGLVAKTPEGCMEIAANLVVGTDGRHSTVRKLAGLEVEDFGAPMDVFWFRLSRRPDDPSATFGRFVAGKIMALINRQDYWQCGYVIPKGDAEGIRKRGLEAFRGGIAEITPFLAGRVHELGSWDDVKLLTVQVNRLRRWHKPGLLCIGDAAHAMSPVGGVGINLAVQDAVAAANILAGPLRDGTLAERHLRAVQRRREFPVRMTQRLQLAMQNNLIRGVLASSGNIQVPFMLKAMQRWPVLRRMTGYLIGIGFRPEHVRTRTL